MSKNLFCIFKPTVFFCFLLFSCLVGAQTGGGSGSSTASAALQCPDITPGNLCTSQQAYCGDKCGNTPYCATTCWTTSSGPPWSGGGSTDATAMLYCKSATYANCHYSGPPWPTGTNSDNRPLPCTLNASGTVADCKCPVFTGENYVNMYGILNLGVFYETVAVCGSDGSNCQNASNCPGDNCTGAVPPVCKYIAEQNPDKPETSLIPGADLISTYGNAMQNNYPSGSTDCPAGFMAGCMTAPCQYDKDDPDYAHCKCPTYWHDPVTLSQDKQRCDPGNGYVWE